MSTTLVGKTALITGATRGIGKAIGLRLARAGANIVIAAKTTESHPTLPGTIYTAAKEIEEAGGQCLAVKTDIRFESEVASAVEAAAARFGGLDVVVNNASAIHLAATVDTDLKRYDLLHSVNARGTFLVSKCAIPHLKRSAARGRNPHILNIAPTLNLTPEQFAGSVAYRISKMGMTMAALGMAAEFSADGVAVNSLWPRAVIWSAAVEHMIGPEARKNCRKPEIVGDAAFLMLSKSSRKFTGNFLIVEDFLKQEGVTDLSKYNEVPGENIFRD